VGRTAAGERRHTLDNYISRLRRLLGRERLSTRAPGYVLHTDEDELDLNRFERPLPRRA
jgi:DNA-binding SARP family transcriptional activator